MLGHSSITITADTYTGLLPQAEPELDGSAKTGPESVPDDADPLGGYLGDQLSVRSRKRPRTRSPRPTGVPSWGEKLQVRAVMRCAPGRIRTCDTRLRSLPRAGC